MNDHRLITYTNSSCSSGANDHGLTGSAVSSNSTIIDGLTDGQYWATVTAYDSALNNTVSTCSTDSIIVDTSAPIDNTANLQFTNNWNNTGNDVAVTWTAFSDTYLSNHRLYTYTNSSCSSGEIDHGLTGSSTNSNASIINGLSDGTYYAKIIAYDQVGNSTTSACSTDSIVIDKTAPADNTAALQFSNSYNNTGNNLVITWTAFTDTYLSNHRIITYTDSGCSTGEVDHGLTGSNTNSNNTIVDGLTDGTYYATVTAYDSAGNSTASVCSTDSIIIDTTNPTNNTANLQFSSAYDGDGNDIAVTWTAFTDTNLSNHRLRTYTDSSCSVDLTDHGLTASSSNSNSTIIDGLADNIYYATVTAIDAAGNTTTSTCSTDSIIVDSTAPTDNTANLQFTALYDVDGNDIAVTWTAFSDDNLSNHRIITYNDSGCTTGTNDHGLTGSNTNSNSTIIDGLADGTYYATVTAYDPVGNSTTSACSTDTIIVDSTAPIDNTADPQFTANYDANGNDIAVTWTAFTDSYLDDHQIITYTNSACSSGANDHGLTGSNTNSNSSIIDGLSDGQYWVKITAYDAVGNSTESSCSSDSIIVDKIAPVDNTANFQFTDSIDSDGNDVSVTWTAFTDTYLSDHRIITYTDSGCSTGANDHGLTGSSINSNSTIIDGLSDGTYYATITAYDSAGNSTVSACSTDFLIVDSNAPTDNIANLQFTDLYDTDGNDIAVTWTAFTDANLSNHKLYTFTNSTCTTGSVDHGQTGSSTNSDSLIIDGLSDGAYYGKVEAYDAANNTTLSACSTDSIIIDSTAPTDNVADAQFTAGFDNDGNDVSITWTAFTDTYLADHRIKTFTNTLCTFGETDHGLTSSSVNSNNVITDGLADGQYWVKIIAYDAAGNSTESTCSTDSIIVDSTNPTDNTANLQFTDTIDPDGNDIAVTWTAFSDSNLSDHRIRTYTNSTCTLSETNHGLTGSTINSNSTIIDGLADGTYYATVTAIDGAGNTSTSACSTDVIIVDGTVPVDNTANLQFTNTYNSTGNNVAITWTAFTDANLSDHRIKTYTDSGCSSGETDHGLTGSSINSDSTIVDGLSDGTYYATVTAIDSAGNTTTSVCSSDSIIIDTTNPTDNTANLQFTSTFDTDGNDIAVTWTAFIDTNLSNHRITTYTDNGCSVGATAHPLTGTTTNSDSITIDGLTDGTYYATVTGFDAAGNFTTSGCSTDSIIIDSTNPTDNTANLQFISTFDTDGNDIAVTWTAFTDSNLSNHRLKTYTNSGCTLGEIDHGLTGTTTNSNSTLIDGLADGTYHATVTAIDGAGNSTVSACSVDSIIVDKTAPTDNTANLQFTSAYDIDGIDVAVTWTAFTDVNLSDHRLYTYTDSSCTLNEIDHGLTSSTTNSNSTNIDGLSDGTYYAKVRAIDLAGNTTLSSCSTDSVIIDSTSPIDNTANLQFTAAFDNDGNNIAFTWTAFTDANLSNHRITTYTDSACSAGEIAHPLTGSTTNSDSTTVDGLTDGTYYAKVTSFDAAGNSTTSACSSDSIVVDTSAPTDNTANLQFTSAYDNDGNNIAVTWTAFSDTNLSDHRLITYTDSGCSAGATDHGLTGATTNSDSIIVDGLTDGTYYATVIAYDSAGNSTVSACSTDSIIVDSTNPTDNTANLQFTAAYDNDGNDVAVTWTAFTDSNLSDHRITTYSDSSCSSGATAHALTGATTNSDAITVDGLADGTYYAIVTAFDAAGNSTSSVCSTDSIIIDSTNPTDNTANAQFTDSFDADGNNLAITWTSFTDTNLSDHRIITYTDSGCSVGATDHGLTGATTSSNSTIVDGLTDGTYFMTITAYDAAGNSTVSACSTDSIIVDTTAPTDNTANLQFSMTYDTDGNNVAVTWTAFTDANLSNHRIITYTDSGCSTAANDHGLTGTTINSDSVIIDGLTNGAYYATVTAYDSAGNSTVSACSTDTVIVDTIAPIDNTANLQFTNTNDNDGNDVAVTWTAFTDTYLADHRITTYTNSGCSAGATAHPLTGSSTNSDSVTVDGLTDGTYWATVTAIDGAGNSTISACSTDTILIDSTAPNDNTANLQFTAVYDTDGNDVAVTWTAFSDTNLSDHRITTYTDSGCSTGAVAHPLTGSSTNSDSVTIDGLPMELITRQ